MNEEDDTTGNPTLTSLLQSCDAIRQQCQSSNHSHSSTRAARRPTTFTASEFAEKILDEEEIAKDLERQILNQRAAILRIKRRREKSAETTTQRRHSIGSSTAGPDAAAKDPSANSKADAKAALRKHRLLLSQVLEESARQKKNNRLLQRMAMARPAKEVAWVNHQDAAAAAAAAAGSEYHDQLILVHETVRCRNELVTKNLQTSRQLDSIKEEMNLAMEEGERLQQLTKETWEALQPHLTRDQMNDPSSAIDLAAIHAKQSTDAETQRLATEIVVLKGIVQDLIVGGKVDWYEDERLRETLQKLE